METPTTHIPKQPVDWVPDACTLPTAEFDDLFATSLRVLPDHTPGSGRARLVLAGDAGLPNRVQQLADAETSCCSFFTFTLTRLDGARCRWSWGPGPTTPEPVPTPGLSRLPHSATREQHQGRPRFLRTPTRS
jgi:hypothetical protein